MAMLSPGLYPQERKASAGPVASVSTSMYATGGWLQKGPVNQAQLITGFDSFVEIFGSYWRNSYVPFMMDAFFDNEGAVAYVFRVVPTDAVKASNNACLSPATVATYYTRVLADPVTTLDATHHDINLKIDAGGAADIDVTGDNGVAGTYSLAALAAILTAIGGITATVETVLGGGNRIKIVSDTPGVVSGLVFAAPIGNDCSEEFLGLDTSATSYTYSGVDALDWDLEARWQGEWYNQVRMCWSVNEDYPDGSGSYTRFNVEIQEESELNLGDWEVKESYEAVNMDDDTSDQFAPTVINDQTQYGTVTEGASYDIPLGFQVASISDECLGEGDGAAVSFSGTILFPEVVEDTVSIVVGIVTATDDGDGALSGTGVSGTINYITGAWTLTYTAPPALGALIVAAYNSLPVREICCQFSGGTDGTGPITRSLISESALEADKEGIYCLNDIDDILNISLPDFAGILNVSNDLISYAEGRADRFALLTTTVGTSPSAAKKYVRTTAAFNTSYAALYYPWVTISDPLTDDNRPLNVPPDGFIAGVYARTDTNRNVGKAPAGISDGKLNGSIGLERVLDKGERDLLYPARVNPLVSSPQTGRAVWGALTLSLDAEWKYIQLRRLFMFCEKSIENSSYWVVFENNGPPTWAKMLSQGNSFFLNLFRDNYLKGATPSDAFQIVIDESNNPQSAIDAGELTADYYIAGNKPGEKIRLRFQQKVAAAA